MTLNEVRPADNDAAITIRNPRDGMEVGTLPILRPNTLGATIAASRQAQRGWSQVAPAERGARVGAIADALRDQAEPLAAWHSRETGRDEGAALAGVLAAVATLEQYAQLGPLHRQPTLRGAAGTVDYTIPEPRGVALVLTPWNDPIAIAAGLVGAALVTGNSVIHKPSERCPHLGMWFGEVVSSMLPPDVFLTVTGASELGETLCAEPRIDVIAHVGSSASGARIAQVASETGAHVIRENGGNDPLIVDRDVDPHWAAGQAALGAFANAGQLCTSVERVFVHEDIAGAFVPALVDAAREFEQRSDWGPLVDERMRHSVHAQVMEALDAGAEALTGATLPPGPGSYYPPTVLVGCTNAMRVMREETFGPVAPVQVVPSLDDAIARANDDRYGLAATVLTDSLERALSSAHDLEFGTVKINDVFGGAPGGSAEPRRASGAGLGYGPGLLDEFTGMKVVHVEPSHVAPGRSRAGGARG